MIGALGALARRRLPARPKALFSARAKARLRALLRTGPLPDGGLDADTRRRLLRVDFFQLTRTDVDALWPAPAPVSVLFPEATCETLLPWREGAASIRAPLMFRPPLDQLFRLSPSFPTKQTVYAFTRAAPLLEPLGAYAERLPGP